MRILNTGLWRSVNVPAQCLTQNWRSVNVPAQSLTQNWRSVNVPAQSLTQNWRSVNVPAQSDSELGLCQCTCSVSDSKLALCQCTCSVWLRSGALSFVVFPGLFLVIITNNHVRGRYRSAAINYNSRIIIHILPYHFSRSENTSRNYFSIWSSRCDAVSFDE
jgi:hypothetical protein